MRKQGDDNFISRISETLRLFNLALAKLLYHASSQNIGPAMTSIQTHLEDSIHPSHDIHTKHQAASSSSSGLGNAPTRTVASITPTNRATPSDNAPPAPRPGAAPIAAKGMSRTAIPPPPKVGEKAMPPQCYLPGPNQQGTSVPPKSTTAINTAAYPIPSTLTEAPSSVSKDLSNSNNPPGYQQNHHASGSPGTQEPSAQSDSFLQPRRHPDSGLLGGNQAANESGQFEGAGDAVDKARRWATEKGGQLAEQVGELHDKVWNSIQGKER